MSDRLPLHYLLLYVDVTVYTDRTGNWISVPGIALDGEVLLPLVDYLIHKSNLSRSWMGKVREAVKLFLQYSLAHIPPAGFGENLGKTERECREHFQSFARTMVKGSFDSTGIDPSGLCWVSSGSGKAGLVIHRLTEYFEWIAKNEHGTPESPFNPRYEGTAYDRLMAQAAYEHRRSRAFLGHTWEPKVSPGEVHAVQSGKSLRVAKDEPPAFPDADFERLLFFGFQVNGRYNWRDILITLLLDGAGFRMSEPMHLYIEDVSEDPARPGSALVRIYHPFEGAAPEGWVDARGKRIVGNRRDYLRYQFGLKPRNEAPGKLHAGWKGGELEDSKKLYKQAYWFPLEHGEWFWRIWRKYLQQIRSLDRLHPYAFVNLDQNVGQPYKLARYVESHKAAIWRAGLVPPNAVDLKALGLTPHGHRHAYGQRLRVADFDPKLNKRFLHHSDIQSQQVYTESPKREIRAAIEGAMKGMGTLMGPLAEEALRDL